MNEYSEAELELIENNIMDLVDENLKTIKNKKDLISMLIDTLESRLKEEQ